MQSALAGTPALDFANVVPLEVEAGDRKINVDTPDTAPTEDEPGAPKQKTPAASPPAKTTVANTAGAAPGH